MLPILIKKYHFGVRIYHKFIFIIAQNYQEGEVTQLIKKIQNLIIKNLKDELPPFFDNFMS
jgi:hypothetical protein